MQTKTNSWFVVVNPKAGSGKAKSLWGKIKKTLAAFGLVFDYALSEYASENNSLSLDQPLKHVQHVMVMVRLPELQVQFSEECKLLQHVNPVEGLVKL